MDKLKEKETRDHLELVISEINNLKKELEINPDGFGDIEHRLYWAIRGVNPHKAICCKHNRKINKNDYGEFICGDCIDENIHNDFDTYDENLWLEPDNEPAIKIKGIQYGNKIP